MIFLLKPCRILTSTLKTIVKPKNIDVRSPSMIVVRPGTSKQSEMFFVLQQLKDQLPKVVIKVGFKCLADFLKSYLSFYFLLGLAYSE